MSVLESSDLQSQTWLRIKKYLESERDRLRELNDHEDTEEKTSFRRGRIKQIKELLRLDEPPKEPRGTRTY